MNKKELERFLLREGSTPLGCYNTLNECISRIRESDEIQPVRFQYETDLQSVIALLDYLKNDRDTSRNRAKENCIAYAIEIEDDFNVRLLFSEEDDGIEVSDKYGFCMNFFETWEDCHKWIAGYYDGLEKGAKRND